MFVVMMGRSIAQLRSQQTKQWRRETKPTNSFENGNILSTLIMVRDGWWDVIIDISPMFCKNTTHLTSYTFKLLDLGVWKLLHLKSKLSVRCLAKQGLVTVPFWAYWTSPYNSHYRPYNYLMVGWCSMGTFNDPCKKKKSGMKSIVQAESSCGSNY